ncbi:MAG: hypothetical protein ABR563_05660 [Pyrinomonadaceae bacterium]
MDDTTTRRMETFIRVQQFGKTHTAAFPDGSRGAEVLSELDTAVTDLEGHATAQASGKAGAREATTLKALANAALREEMKAISETARAIAITVPGLEEKFRLPHNAGAQVWLAAARAFAQDAAPLKSEFVRRGMPADFLDQLAEKIAACEQATGGRAQKHGEHVAATAAIDTALERGVNAVRELDAIVRNLFRDDAGVLAEWTSASHTERAPRGGNTPVPPASQTTPASPATPAHG